MAEKAKGRVSFPVCLGDVEKHSVKCSYIHTHTHSCWVDIKVLHSQLSSILNWGQMQYAERQLKLRFTGPFAVFSNWEYSHSCYSVPLTNLNQHTNKVIINISVVQNPLVHPAALANQAKQTKLYLINSLFSLSHRVLTLFLESCYDASIFFAPVKTNTLAHFFNWSPSISDCLMLSPSSPFPLFSFFGTRFTAWGPGLGGLRL